MLEIHNSVRLKSKMLDGKIQNFKYFTSHQQLHWHGMTQQHRSRTQNWQNVIVTQML